MMIFRKILFNYTEPFDNVNIQSLNPSTIRHVKVLFSMSLQLAGQKILGSITSFKHTTLFYTVHLSYC
jgi:hypothetical protein